MCPGGKEGHCISSLVLSSSSFRTKRFLWRFPLIKPQWRSYLWCLTTDSQGQPKVYGEARGTSGAFAKVTFMRMSFRYRSVMYVAWRLHAFQDSYKHGPLQNYELETLCGSRVWTLFLYRSCAGEPQLMCVLDCNRHVMSKSWHLAIVLSILWLS